MQYRVSSGMKLNCRLRLEDQYIGIVTYYCATGLMSSTSDVFLYRAGILPEFTFIETIQDGENGESISSEWHTCQQT
jgi:hypothetical protein